MTIAVVDKQVFGNKRLHVVSFVATSSTEGVETGLKIIDHFAYAVSSANTANFKVWINAATAATADNGFLTIGGCTAGDEIYVYCYGK